MPRQKEDPTLTLVHIKLGEEDRHKLDSLVEAVSLGTRTQVIRDLIRAEFERRERDGRTRTKT